jgi:hypothetical protein
MSEHRIGIAVPNFADVSFECRADPQSYSGGKLFDIRQLWIGAPSISKSL